RGADDGEGGRIFADDFHIFELAGGCRVAVRGSGTEPKVKFYLFAVDQNQDLMAAKVHVAKEFDNLQNFLREDARRRTA
ncbi:MAG: phospho-sugar mutase, partial [Puniceicoccales bacterium]|nr:phospho-sugar mutase [Puniceicoccales bacterium]